MKVLVTGASGFIGSHVTRALLNAGHDVLVLATPNDDLCRLQDLLPRVDVMRGILQDVPGIQGKLRGWKPNACIHLAWYAEPGKYLNALENLDSLQASINLLHVLNENGCEHFIGAGTCAEYEMKTKMLVEIDKTKPETLYAASKLSFQMIGDRITAQAGMRFAWGRIFYLYGAYEDPRRLVPAAILNLQNSKTFSASPGEQIRDYLHVKDVANAFLALIEKQAEGIYNICSAEPVTIKCLLDTIGNLMGRQDLIAYGALSYRNWEPMFICGKNDRLRSLGWTPRVSLQTGLKETIDWWKVQLEKNRENSD
jgi:nucleoside-diphosphate-sugar epimerase